MKKVLSLLICLTLVMAMFTACGKKDDKKDATAPTATPEATDTKDDAADTTDTATDSTDAATAKTGLAVVTSLAKSAPAGAEDGLAEVDSTVVAVLVGQDGKILKCNIDVAQTKVNFSAEGKITTDLATEMKSKQELKEEYGMKKASGIGKEWYEQANAFATYAVGKTVDELKGIALDEEGHATDADITASVTVHINEFIEAIDKAVATAQDLGAGATDKLGLGINTSISGSKDVATDAEGLAQAYSYYTVTTTNAEGKITSCLIDASQGNVNFDAKGVITTDLTVAPQTKQELKEAYGMKKASAIGKEWYEQANAFAAYVTGKSVDEVNTIALDEEGHATAEDITASVTVHVGDFIETVNKAVASAQ